MTSSNLFKHGGPIIRGTTFFSLLITFLFTMRLFSPGPSIAIDFKIPPQGYKTQNCHTIKNTCESKCQGAENLSSCQNCCKRDWYWCLAAQGKAGNPGDVLQPDDLAEFQAKCGETFDSKTKKKAIQGIPLR